MKRLFSLMLVAFLVLGSLNAEAARRLGGGKSVGQQSSNVTQRNAAPAAPSQAAPAAAPKPATPAAPAAAPKKPWGAMLGGLAAGLGLAWLASSLGMGGALGQILLFGLLALAVMMVIGMVMRARSKSSTASSAGPLAFEGAAAGDRFGADAAAPVQPRSCGQRCFGPAMGAQRHGIRRGQAGRRQHDRFGIGRLPELGHSQLISMPRAS
jgi:predicted lipid-binding transport protein (Tim44 family)